MEAPVPEQGIKSLVHFGFETAKSYKSLRLLTLHVPFMLFQNRRFLTYISSVNHRIILPKFNLSQS